jgi:hypothetical protein
VPFGYELPYIVSEFGEDGKGSRRTDGARADRREAGVRSGARRCGRGLVVGAGRGRGGVGARERGRVRPDVLGVRASPCRTPCPRTILDRTDDPGRVPRIDRSGGVAEGNCRSNPPGAADPHPRRVRRSYGRGTAEWARPDTRFRVTFRRARTAALSVRTFTHGHAHVRPGNSGFLCLVATDRPLMCIPSFPGARFDRSGTAQERGGGATLGTGRSGPVRDG